MSVDTLVYTNKYYHTLLRRYAKREKIQLPEVVPLIAVDGSLPNILVYSNIGIGALNSKRILDRDKPLYKVHKTTLPRYIRGLTDKNVPDHIVLKLAENVAKCKYTFEITKDLQTIRDAYDSPYIQSCMSTVRKYRDIDYIRGLLFTKYNMRACDFYYYNPQTYLAVIKNGERIVARCVLRIVDQKLVVMGGVYGVDVYKYVLRREIKKKYPKLIYNNITLPMEKFSMPGVNINDVLRGGNDYRYKIEASVIWLPYMDIYFYIDASFKDGHWEFFLDKHNFGYAKYIDKNLGDSKILVSNQSKRIARQ